MATYTNTGWKATNLTYTGRSSSNNPYTAGEFSEAIPTRSANRKTDEYADRPEETETQIYVKLDRNRRVVNLKNDGKDYRGDEWKAFTIRQPNNFDGYGLQDFAKRKNLEFLQIN